MSDAVSDLDCHEHGYHALFMFSEVASSCLAHFLNRRASVGLGIRLFVLLRELLLLPTVESDMCVSVY